MKTMNALLVAGLAIAGLTAAAGADSTVATFADPSNGSVSLFQFNAGTGTLTGGYSGTNLLLQTPGLPAVGDISGAQFVMTPLSAIGAFGNVYHLGAGSISFVDALNAPLLTISFGDAWLTGSLGLGASDFMSNSVTFTGPAWPASPRSPTRPSASASPTPSPPLPRAASRRLPRSRPPLCW